MSYKRIYGRERKQEWELERERKWELELERERERLRIIAYNNQILRENLSRYINNNNLGYLLNDSANLPEHLAGEHVDPNKSLLLRKDNKNPLYKVILSTEKYPELNRYLDLLLKSTEGKASINSQDTSGYTPLMLASASHLSSAETVRILIANGADMEILDNSKNSALSLACEYSNTSSVEKVKVLIDSGASLNGNPTKSPLMASIQHGSRNMEVVKLLLAKGVDINQQDFAGGTALIKACYACKEQNSIELIKFLIDNDADLYIKNKCSYNAFMTLLKSNPIDVITTVMDMFASKNYALDVDDVRKVVSKNTIDAKIIFYLIDKKYLQI